MKNRYKLFRTILLLPLLLQSCHKEPLELRSGNDTLITLSVRVPAENTPGTRAMTDANESAVATMDIFLFKTSTDGGGFVHHTTASQVTIGNDNKGTFSVQLPIGTYDMVLIANARSQCTTALASLTAASTRTSLQQALTVTNTGKWKADDNDYTPIPMWGQVTPAIITEGCKIEGINLTRMLSRINVTPAQNLTNFTLTHVYLYHHFTEGFIIPQDNDWALVGGKPTASDPSLAPAWTHSSAAPLEYTGAEAAGQCVNEIYTFEAPAADLTDDSKNTFLVIGGKYGTDISSTFYRIDLAADQSGTLTHLPLLRNHKYEIFIRAVTGSGAATYSDAASAPAYNLKSELVVIDEGDMQYFVYDDHYFLGADDREMEVDHNAGQHTFEVRTDHPQGWRAVVSGSATEVTALTGGWLTIDAPANGGTGTSDLNYTVLANGTSNPRTAYIHISTDSGLKMVIAISQQVSIGNIVTSPMTYGYVGAFWRADQTGERLIRILRSANSNTIDGEWTATVVEGKDWIILDTRPSENVTDGGITWNAATENPADMNLPANDTKYRVTGNATTVSGICMDDNTGEIYFRIGLKSKHTPTDQEPARYGVVLLTYNKNSKSQLLYIRQGHDPDYLMRPSDPVNSGGMNSSARPLAWKYSPYNLTAQAYRDNPSNTAHFIALDKRGEGDGTNYGVFTEYPTQTGAFFQFASTPNPRHAYHPTNPSANGIPSGWSSAVTSNAYWNTLGADHETCPAGYRRPRDGGITGATGTVAIASSEERQSLWLNPQTARGNNTDNGVWGYYADGFFDRREITSSISNAVHSSVCASTTDTRAAYIGFLFYNKYNNASLFFPAGGFRTIGGALGNNAGGYSYLWSASAESGSTGSDMGIAKNTAYHFGDGRSYGMNIRCVPEQ